MKKEQVIKQLKHIIEEKLEQNKLDNLNEEDRIFEDLGIDSIMVLQLMIYIEESFNIEMPEESMDPGMFETVGSFVTFIKEQQNKLILENSGK
jgi:acyl carrier protein